MLRTAENGQRLLFASDAEARFEQFHAENGHVYAMLRDMALALKRAGHKRWGMRNLYEKVRYDLAVQTTDKAPVLNDHFAPYYSRKLMAEVPELENFFEIRERH